MVTCGYASTFYLVIWGGVSFSWAGIINNRLERRDLASGIFTMKVQKNKNGSLRMCKHF
jgi:hypothetical protein